jgi:hypothetical protein
MSPRERWWICRQEAGASTKSTPRTSKNGENSNEQMTAAGYRLRFAVKHSSREKAT